MTYEALLRALQSQQADLGDKVIVADAFYGDRKVVSVGRRKDGTIVIRRGELIQR